MPRVRLSDSGPRNIHSDLSGGAVLILTIALRGVPRKVTMNMAFIKTVSSGAKVAITNTLTLTMNVTVRGFPRKTVVSLPLRTNKTSHGESYFLKVVSKIMRPVNTMLAIVFTKVTIPLLPCLLSFTTKTVVCIMARRLVPRSRGNGRSGVKAVNITVNFALVVVLSITLK